MIKTPNGTLPDNWQDIPIFRGIIPPNSWEVEVNLMAKDDEDIFIYDGYVYKYFQDSRRCLSRLSRTLDLVGITPKIVEWDEHWYKYKYVEGPILTNKTDRLLNYLNWMQHVCWIDYIPDEYGWAQAFYIDRTLMKIKKFNDVFVNHWVSEQVFDDTKMCRRWHGDCSFENVVCIDDGYVLLDWRENPSDDTYYDIAKLIKSVHFNHLTLDAEGNWKGHDAHLEDLIIHWAVKQHYDVHAIYTIFAIAVLKMAGTHHSNFSRNLFRWGKDLIQKGI